MASVSRRTPQRVIWGKDDIYRYRSEDLSEPISCVYKDDLDSTCIPEHSSPSIVNSNNNVNSMVWQWEPGTRYDYGAVVEYEGKHIDVISNDL